MLFSPELMPTQQEIVDHLEGILAKTEQRFQQRYERLMAYHKDARSYEEQERLERAMRLCSAERERERAPILAQLYAVWQAFETSRAITHVLTAAEASKLRGDFKDFAAR